MTELTSTLTAALDATESARRAGWAKFYEAETRAEDASRDANIARGDLAAVVTTLAYVTGFLDTYAPDMGGKRAIETLHRITRQWRSALPPKALHAGREAGRIAAAEDAESFAKKTVRAEVKRSRNALQKSFKAGQKYELERLAKRYGFANAAALLNHLEAGTDG